MTYTGRIVNGVVVLPPEAQLPEGAVVEVTPRAATSDMDALTQAALALAKPRTHLPADYALNHGHYVRGEPQK